MRAAPTCEVMTSALVKAGNRWHTPASPQQRTGAVPGPRSGVTRLAQLLLLPPITCCTNSRALSGAPRGSALCTLMSRRPSHEKSLPTLAVASATALLLSGLVSTPPSPPRTQRRSLLQRSRPPRPARFTREACMSRRGAPPQLRLRILLQQARRPRPRRHGQSPPSPWPSGCPATTATPS
jgi:hypothetical protein